MPYLRTFALMFSICSSVLSHRLLLSFGMPIGLSLVPDLPIHLISCSCNALGLCWVVAYFAALIPNLSSVSVAATVGTVALGACWLANAAGHSDLRLWPSLVATFGFVCVLSTDAPSQVKRLVVPNLFVRLLLRCAQFLLAPRFSLTVSVRASCSGFVC